MEVVSYIGIGAVAAAFVYAFARKAPLSLTISIAILAVYALLAASSPRWGDPTWSMGYRDLVLWHPGQGHVEESYTFFTSMFVHQNLLHLTFNMAALVFIGTSLEERIGSPPFALIFIVGGVMGTLTYYLINYSDVFILLGASGAISAELGAYARLYPKERITLFVPFPLPPIPAIWVAVAFLAVSSLLVFIIPNIAHEAHIGGLLTGLLIGPLAARLPSRTKTAAVKIDAGTLEPLAITAELKNILAKIKTETLPDVRLAWIERLVERAKCPKCDGSLRLVRSKVVSECGWRLHLR